MNQLVYLSPVPWKSFTQRPHKFVEWFHKTTNAEVIWVDPYPTRLPSYRDFRWRKNFATALPPVSFPSWLNVIGPKALPIEPLPGASWINRIFWEPIYEIVNCAVRYRPTMLGIGKPSELALQLLKESGFSTTFYDAMDDFSAFYHGLSRKSMARRERFVVEQVEKVFVSSTSLYEYWSKKREVGLAHNACSVDILPPVETCVRSQPQHILGYVGTIGEWFDWEMVSAIARTRPRVRVRLMGPLFSQVPVSLPNNIELLPPCSHEDAIAAMHKFSVGMIPFKKSRLTDSVDPIKYYEYRALGLPVLSSSFGEMHYHNSDPGVFLVGKNDDIGVITDMALAYETTFGEINDFRARNSWEARFGAAGIFK